MQKFKKILSISVLSLVLGISGGIIGAMFFHSYNFVTRLRLENIWLLYFLPLGGLMTVFIYKSLKTEGIGTNQVLLSLKGETKVSPLLLPAVFSGAILTHLLGGSAGREGAALQMGGSVAALLSKKLKLKDSDGNLATICGMSAFFSALFGTPLGASVFAAEVVFSKKLSLKAIFPSLISGYTAYGIALSLRVHPERFSLNLPDIDFSLMWKTAVIIIACSAVCLLFLFTLHKTQDIFKRIFKNTYLRIAVGGLLIIALTLIEGSGDYNGGGMHIIERIFTHSQVKTEAFFLKIVFTALTVAAGFKGGEIVPTFFVGAASGGALALLLGSSAPFGSAIGMAVLFSGATNCPLAAIFICCEMFGFKGVIYFAAASIISRLLTTNKRLYNAF